jgi:hypothetical protein
VAPYADNSISKLVSAGHLYLSERVHNSHGGRNISAVTGSNRSVMLYVTSLSLTDKSCNVVSVQLVLLAIQRPSLKFNHLTPNGRFSGRTPPLTYRGCIFLFIQQIYVLNILNMLHTLGFFLFKMSFIS